MTGGVVHSSRWNSRRPLLPPCGKRGDHSIAAQAHRAGKALEYLSTSMTLNERKRNVANQEFRS
jgi:hypothetical protein